MFTYDELNRVTQITQSGNGVASKRVEMSYDAASQMTEVTRYNSNSQLVAQSNYVYDEAGRLVNLTHSREGNPLAESSWVYDAANRIIQQTSPDGTSNYNYDARHQLIESVNSDLADETYSYDNNGNRTNKIKNSTICQPYLYQDFSRQLDSELLQISCKNYPRDNLS